MKRSYESPAVTNYGSVEALTQVTGTDTAKDTLFFNGEPLAGVETDGSADISLP
jgi:hypothetical protein